MNHISNHYLAIANLQQLIDGKQVMRIMQPALIEQVKTAVSPPTPHPHILFYNGNYYLTLHQIRDERQREKTFHLLRQMQLGEEIDTTRLPTSIRRIFQANATSTKTLSGSLTVSLFIGIVCGLMAMAIGVLILTTAGGKTETASGMQTTAVIFIIASVICWLIATFVIWAKGRWRRDGMMG